MTAKQIPKGDVNREAIDALGGYVYQIYQSALAWIELEPDEFLFLEVAEDYAVLACNALIGVQVKETGHTVTINSKDILTSIDSFVDLRQRNPDLHVELRHLTTSRIGKEKATAHRIGETPTLETWRKLAKAGDLEPFRKILDNSKLSIETKNFISTLDDTEFREEFLKRIHFDCGALDSKFQVRQLQSKLSKLMLEHGGVHSQVEGCLNSILVTLLKKATQKEDRFVDRNDLENLLEKATQIPINRAQLEAQNELIAKALSASIPQSANLVTTRLTEPRPINEVPIPVALASRTIQIDNIVSSLSHYGISWIFGAAGVGKTIGAKIAARHIGGNWVGINLRGLNSEQVSAVLSVAIDRLTEKKLDGLLIDDFECSFEPHILDKLFYLLSVSSRRDLLLIFTSPRPLSSDFLSSVNLPASIEQKLEEFSAHDIEEMLSGLGVNPKWAEYIHIISGGGHPQLAIAAIQSMQNKNWNTDELKTLDSLLVGNPAIEMVRARTRERLLNELPEGGRRLLERLSLKPGSFRRSFVLDMAQVTPRVPDAGIFFEQLIGSWVDQQELDRFALSPLLSNYALKTLTDGEKRTINFEIANSLTKGKSLDPTEANSALLAALAGKNTEVIFRLCMAVLKSDQNVLEIIAPHLMIFTLMRTDVSAYEDDPAIGQMIHGTQLIILCHSEGGKENIQEVLDRFEAERDRVVNGVMKASMDFLVYSKVLLSTPKFGAFPNFWNLVRKLDTLLENKQKDDSLEILRKEALWEIDGAPLVGFMFLNQARQIKLIDELIPAFEFLDSCEPKLRTKLLKPYIDPNYDMDMLVSGPWLQEHKANTIDPPRHSDVYARLEDFAKSWANKDLAVCCRKYRAIIIDEYGGDKDKALTVLDEGLSLYGETNSELVRAKAKVLYRAEDHQGSLKLSKVLIDGNAPLNELEKAYLGRDAAISAEKQGDYIAARRYYLYGSEAAGRCNLSDMVPMQVGMMADAALASWHSGDRETCLRDLVSVLRQIQDIDPKSSLRAAHCHATCRHILLWLDQDATGEKRLLENGEETKIIPGIVSNPEPHPEIGKRFIVPVEMAWYMLAVVENDSCLDVGISENFEKYLPNGPVFEGQFLLTSAKMRKAFTLCDTKLFVEALRETAAEFAYVRGKGDYKNSFNIENVTFGSFPVPTLEQQDGLSNLTEQLVLCFVSNCIFLEQIADLEQLITSLEVCQGFKVRKELLSALRGHGLDTDYNTSMAALLAVHRSALSKNGTLPPRQIFELAFKTVQVAGPTNNIHVISKFGFEWLCAKWTFIFEHQRFLLRSPAFYEKSINEVVMAKGGSWLERLLDLLQAILPTMRFNNESELSRMLKDIRGKVGDVPA